MRRVLWLLMVTSLLPGLACDDDPAGPLEEPSPGVFGTVLDADGLPVAGAPVGIVYGLPPEAGPSDWPPEDWPSEETCGLSTHAYRFSLDAPSTVTLRILDHRERCVCTLVEAVELPAGNTQISWQRRNDAGALVAAGAYRARLEIHRTGFSDVQESSYHLLNTLSVNYEDCLGPATLTDSDGRFRIAYTDLPLGTEVDCGYQQNCTVPDTLWIQTATPAGRARQFLRITDLDSDQEVSLVLSPAP